ncbi:hypothetical protein Tco_0919144, partial [Tanacetum coccineum]
KRVGPFPARRLAWRRVSHHSSDRHSSPDFTSDSSSSGLSSDSSLDTFSGSPSDSLSDTSIVHSSRCATSGQTHSGPSTRVASSRLLDSSLLSAGPSRKRCRSPATSHMEIGTADVEAVADLGIGDRVRVDTELEAGQLMASAERAGLTNMIKRLGRENLRVQALLCFKRDQVDSLRHHMALSQEKFHQIRRDRDDARRRLRRLESFIERRLGFRP